MGRENKFKSKVLENISKPDKYYWLEYTLTEAIFKDLAVDLLRSVATCSLITKSRNIEIYEHDCWYNKQDDYYILYEYDDDGLLYECIKRPNAKGNSNNWLRTETDVFPDLNKFTFIGNWHDGEEYLLKQIEEVSK